VLDVDGDGEVAAVVTRCQSHSVLLRESEEFRHGCRNRHTHNTSPLLKSVDVHAERSRVVADYSGMQLALGPFRGGVLANDNVKKTRETKEVR